jgi:hypothetical protein
MKPLLTLFVVCFLISGCTYNAHVLSTSAPAAEIMQNKRVNAAIGYELDRFRMNLNNNIVPEALDCSAYNYILDAGDSFETSLVNVLENTFTKVTSSNYPETKPGERFKFFFTVESYRPKLHFSSGMWSMRAYAENEIVMKIRAINDSNSEIVRATAAGTGTADMEGSCSTGSTVLSDATQIAMKRVLEDFIYKVINADYFK